MTELRLLESVASLHRGLHHPATPSRAARRRRPTGRRDRGDMGASAPARHDRRRGVRRRVPGLGHAPGPRSRVEAAGGPPGLGGRHVGDQEGRVLARVRHPNVVTIYGAERSGTHVGLWMEFVHGRTLQRALAEGGTFPPPGGRHRRRTGARPGRGARRRPRARRHQGPERHARRRRAGRADGFRRRARPRPATPAAAGGTPMYLAPEVLRGEPASVQSDIYALGAVLFHLLTGAFPVQARDLQALHRAHDEGSRGHPVVAARSRTPARRGRRPGDPSRRRTPLRTAPSWLTNWRVASSRPWAKAAALAALIAAARGRRSSPAAGPSACRARPRRSTASAAPRRGGGLAGRQ